MVQLYNTDALASVTTISELFSLMTLDLDSNDTPFSPAKQAKLFLTNIANNYPHAAQAFLHLCRGEDGLAFDCIKRNLDPSMRVVMVNPFLTPAIFPLALMIFERLAAHELGSIQVADRPQSKVFFMDSHMSDFGLLQLRLESRTLFARTKKHGLSWTSRDCISYTGSFSLEELCKQLEEPADAIAKELNNDMLKEFMEDQFTGTLREGVVHIFKRINVEPTHLIIGKTRSEDFVNYHITHKESNVRAYPGLQYLGTTKHDLRVFEHALPDKDDRWILLRRGPAWSATPYVLMPYTMEDWGVGVATRMASHVNDNHVVSGGAATGRIDILQAIEKYADRLRI